MLGGRLGCVHAHRLDARRVGQRVAGHDVAERVEEQAQPCAARIDDTGLGEHGELLGRAIECYAGCVARPADECRQVRCTLCTLGRRSRDAEDRALDGPDHRLARHAISARERVGECGHRNLVVVPKRLGDPTEQLGEDHSGVPSRAHE